LRSYFEVHAKIQLPRFSQQGWEHWNAAVASLFFKETQRGGFVVDGIDKSKLWPIARWLQRRLMWISGNAATMFKARREYQPMKKGGDAVARRTATGTSSRVCCDKQVIRPVVTSVSQSARTVHNPADSVCISFSREVVGGKKSTYKWGLSGCVTQPHPTDPNALNGCVADALVDDYLPYIRNDWTNSISNLNCTRYYSPSVFRMARWHPSRVKQSCIGSPLNSSGYSTLASIFNGSDRYVTLQVAPL
jgi:hypothetical protein